MSAEPYNYVHQHVADKARLRETAELYNRAAYDLKQVTPEQFEKNGVDWDSMIEPSLFDAVHKAPRIGVLLVILGVGIAIMALIALVALSVHFQGFLREWGWRILCGAGVAFIFYVGLSKEAIDERKSGE